MATDSENFEAWYAAILEGLYPKRDAGFIIATVAFPLLERYVRQKIKLTASENLNDGFYDAVMRLIPGFKDRSQTKSFWSACRNGLLHQATLQLETHSRAVLPPLALTHDIDRIFAATQEGVLLLHPVLFAKCVIEIIRRDFETFVGQAHIGPALSKAGPFIAYGAQVLHTMTISTSPMIITGTSTKP